MPIISKEQKENIRTEIEQILKFSQAYSSNATSVQFNGIEKWLDIWEENKERFYSNLLHNQLIYEYGKVEFHISDQHRRELLDNFVSSVCDMVEWDETYPWKDFIEFTVNNRDTFFENFVQDNLFERRGAKKGMKFVKALKFFIPADSLETIQNLASTYIQKDKCKGILCFSIHPLDYLTSSENGYNWRSCHALDGEYRAGNISYMLDNCTIVCYLKGEDTNIKSPRIPPDLKWNSKKWRMLLHINIRNTLAFAGRQYPFFSDSIFNYLDKFLFGIWNDFTDAQVSSVKLNGKDESEIYPYIKTLPLPINNNWIFRTKTELIRNGKHNLAYNDLLNSSCYEPFYSVPIKHFTIDDIENLKIIVGKQVPCACCGENIAPESNSFLCTSCHNNFEYESDDSEEEPEEAEQDWICTNCGNRYFDFSDISNYDIYGNYVCQNCVEHEYKWCENCQAWVWKPTILQVNGHEKCPRCNHNLNEGEN